MSETSGQGLEAETKTVRRAQGRVSVGVHAEETPEIGDLHLFLEDLVNT